MNAFIQNLWWGLSGFIESILINHDLSALWTYVIQAAMNALFYGHQ